MGLSSFKVSSEKLFTAIYRDSAHSKTMNELRDPYTTFMASTRHHDMSDIKFHYVPLLATDSAEIDRLHELNNGTKILEGQQRGAAVVSEMTKIALMDGDPQVMQYFQVHAAPALYNSNAYHKQGTSKVMNSQINMPFMVDPHTGTIMTQEDALTHTMQALDNGEVAASEILANHNLDHLPKYRVNEALRQIGSGSLWLANITLPSELASRNPFEIQYAVRARSLDLVERARTMGRAIGMHPSLAALSDIDSVYSAHLRRNAPTKKARSAIAQAQEAYALAA